MRKKRVSLLLTLIMLMSLLPGVTVFAASGDFVPSAGMSAYARSFYDACEGETWFVNYIEALLNSEQKSLNNISGQDEFKNIKAIGLDDAGIEGKIPAAIGELFNLQYLFLGGNNLSGDIPAELFSLDKLQNIDLSGNNYSGAIPSGFGGMQSLTVLNLKNNSYSGTIPTEILNNTQIEVLNLMGNKLTGQIPAGIKNMTSLTYLNLSNNTWGGTMPDLTGLSSLIALSMWDCGFTGEIHNSVYALTNLQILDLAENGFTGEISSSIGNLTKLEYLTLANNRLEGVIPQEIDKLAALEEINLADNYLRGEIPDAFDAASLAMIDLRNNYLRGIVPSTLEDKYNAGALVYLQNNYLTGTFLKGMTYNDKNFADGASTEQYQLASTYTTLQIFEDKTVNIYTSLRNKSYTSGNTTQKVLLKPDEYTLSYDNTLVEVTIDANGIYVRALAALPKSDGVTITIQILANDGSSYSTVVVSLTTDTLSGGGISAGGGGGGGGVTNPDEPETLETHNPYINGYPDGTFQPNGNVTREEIAKMLIVALQIEERSPGVGSYDDVAKDRWSYAYVETATERGYLEGYGDGVFGPSNSMTRAELATALVRIAEKLGMAEGDETVGFTDVSEDKWYASYVEKAAQLGLVTGYEDGTFRPENTVTRAEAVTMINRMLDRDPETAQALKEMDCPFSDVAQGHWAYLNILEASETHEH